METQLESRGTGATRGSGAAGCLHSGFRIPNSEGRPRWASRDREELEHAIWRHLTEQIVAPRTGGDATQRRRGRARNAYAFELWIGHLALLEQALEVAPIPWQELRAEELDGLLLLRSARERFRREYHPCAECGAPVKGKICPRCGAVR